MEPNLTSNPPALTAQGRGLHMLALTWAWAGRQGMLVLLTGAYVAALATFGRVLVSIDSWLALTAGRLVALHGIPTHDTLTVFAHGRRWVDQQWLAQLTIYELDRLGGIRLALVVHLLLLGGSLAAAMVVARRRGAGARSVTLVALVAFLPLLIGTLQLRTQSLAYPLFVAVLAIASAQSPVTWSRLTLLLGLLCLWSNLHGSVILGAAFVALRGATDLFHDLRAGRRPGVLALSEIALPWPCLLVTPFPLEIPHYYAQTVFNSSFGHYLGAWAPSTLSPVSLPLFVLAFGFVWLLARPSSGFGASEKLIGLVLVALALLAVRNWVWLALGAVALYPLALDRSRAKDRGPFPAPLNQVCAITGAVFVLFAAGMLAHSESWFTSSFPDPAARAVARLAAAAPRDRIFASVRWGDWLLWKEPQLAGRIAYDARAELFTSRQIKTMVLMRDTSSLLPEIRRRYRIFLVDRKDEPAVYATLRREGHVAYDNGNVLVVSFPRSRAA